MVSPIPQQNGRFRDEAQLKMSDLCYDVLTILQSKLEGLAVYDRHIADCMKAGDDQCRRLFEQIKQEDERQVDLLCAEVERLVREDKLR